MGGVQVETNHLARVFQETLYYSGISSDAMRALMVIRANQLLCSTDSRYVFQSVSDEVVAIVVLTYLGWDSELLGRKCGRFEIYTTDRITASDQLKKVIQSAMQFAIKDNFQHLYVRVPSSWFAVANVLSKIGFLYTDGLLLFSIDLNKSKVKSDCEMVRIASQSDLNSCVNLAKNSFRQTRFHSDPSISYTEAESIYEQWVRNSFSTAADSVVIAEINQQIAGFVTCKHQHDTYEITGKRFGTIGLVATAEKFRGQGVGKIVTFGALDWFVSQGIDLVEVGTQISNMPASRLYEACGFKLTSTSLTFHWSDSFNSDFS